MYPERAANQPLQEPTVYVGGAVRDAVGVNATPGAVAVREGRIVAAGEVDAVLREAGVKARRIDLPDRLLIPGLVNAHAHLDLTDVGYRPYGGDFIGWIRMVMAERKQLKPEGVLRGTEASVHSGVFTVGDIAATSASAHFFRSSPTRGVSYIEVIGISESEIDVSSCWMKSDAKRGGVEVHAPYSCGPLLVEFFGRLNVRNRVPVTIHLAETREECEFVSHANGPFRTLLESLGKWNDEYSGCYGNLQHPVEWLFTHSLTSARWLCAHCNYVEDKHISMLAENGASVAYCPRASEYFGHKNHRYRDMIEAGVNVCLGTDSIICHGTLSILDEMRRLYQRDKTDPLLLLKMATVNGMRGLQMDEKDATFAPGAKPGVVAIHYDARPGIDALATVLGGTEAPRIEVLEGVA